MNIVSNLWGGLVTAVKQVQTLQCYTINLASPKTYLCNSSKFEVCHRIVSSICGPLPENGVPVPYYIFLGLQRSKKFTYQ